MIETKEEIKQLIQEDHWMMGILKQVKELNLPDWWVCAGFVRSKVWDELHGNTVRTPLNDIDVIYFDEKDTSEITEKYWENELEVKDPSIPWSVKNQARMHRVNDLAPYTSSEDGISKFPEAATALGIKLDPMNQLILSAPHGIKDVVNLEVKPTPLFAENLRLSEIYESRIEKKNWRTTWNKLRIYYVD
ncbi:hypothetical protein CEY16_06630 [Halalkalibacillus sediminis]|uniref:Nucleotidyltransferase family protein n=1 Tax=Halalkalibacillus sediminis TaxID=2018042 RepID=A0A2I0QTI0_9BACI|nr:nucleotidyltransferase family protein [Halalkalibacillus sediminis]PKR77608.1 hypothetical protein CEY16_06630 [Halalkalibacillus sediminis]